MVSILWIYVFLLLNNDCVHTQFILHEKQRTYSWAFLKHDSYSEELLFLGDVFLM